MQDIVKYKNTLLFIRQILFDVFWISFLAIMVFVALELLKTGFVSYHFNVNVLFIISLVSGIASVFIPGKEEVAMKKRGFMIWVYGFGLACVVYIFFSTPFLGVWRYLLTAFFVMVYAVCLYVFTFDERSQQ